MERYFKANPLVARHLGVTAIRFTAKDGNYILWQDDIRPFGPLSHMHATLEQIGGIVLTGEQALAELRGTATPLPLPVATDPRFVLHTTEQPADEPPTEPPTAEPSTAEPSTEQPATEPPTAEQPGTDEQAL